MSAAQLLATLEFLTVGRYRPGADNEAAHQICQEHEGEPLFDWVHALVHRIEGDDANAAYWYGRAEKTRHAGSIEEESQIVRRAIDNI